MNSLFDLRGKRAVVTGASRGLGQAMAIALAEGGADVALIQRTDLDTKTRDQIRGKGRKSEIVTCDLAIPNNAIAPGYFETEMNDGLMKDSVRSKQIIERIPSGRWGQPADLAGAIIYLSSSASDYVNGHILVVDGGWLGR
jgi:NAD(P)-dependent dehydrogenase (short-subunit alcohol dehydrogenase family)